MIHIHRFISEGDVNYYKSMSNDKIKRIVDGKRDLYRLPDGDLDILLEQFREEGFTKYCREERWTSSFTKVLNNDGKVNNINTYTAYFRFVNKWGQKSENTKYQVLVDNNMEVLWIGLYDKNQYFISAGKNVYSLRYEHKYIYLFPNISSNNEYFCKENDEMRDCLLDKYWKRAGAYRYGTNNSPNEIFEKEKIGAAISIEDYFDKKFFYKGLKWNGSWAEYYGYNYITVLIDIMVRDNLFCLDIENVTYPFHGYVLLDLEQIKIIEAKRC